MDRCVDGGDRRRAELAPVESGDDAPAEADGVELVGGEVVGQPGEPRVHLGTTERLVVGLLPRGHLQQRGAGEEHLGAFLDHHHVIGHAWEVGATGRGVAEHESDRRDAVRRRPGQVAEGSPAGDEDLLLRRQVGAAGLDEVDRREAVLQGDVGGPEGLAQRVRVARSAPHRRVAGADQALDAADDADAGDDAGADRVVGAVRGERAELQERGVLVEEQFDPLAGEQLAPLAVPLGVLRPAAADRLGVLGIDLGEAGQHRLAVGGERCRPGVEVRAQDGHTTDPDLGGVRLISRSGRRAVRNPHRRPPSSTIGSPAVLTTTPRGCRRGASAATRRAPWPGDRSAPAQQHPHRAVR